MRLEGVAHVCFFGGEIWSGPQGTLHPEISGDQVPTAEVAHQPRNKQTNQRT